MEWNQIPAVTHAYGEMIPVKDADSQADKSQVEINRNGNKRKFWKRAPFFFHLFFLGAKSNGVATCAVSVQPASLALEAVTRVANSV